MPAQQLGMVALDELVPHGWDLARGTGQPFNCDPDSTAAVLAFTSASTAPEPDAGVVGTPAHYGGQSPFRRWSGFRSASC